MSFTELHKAVPRDADKHGLTTCSEKILQGKGISRSCWNASGNTATNTTAVGCVTAKALCVASVLMYEREKSIGTSKMEHDNALIWWLRQYCCQKKKLLTLFFLRLQNLMTVERHFCFDAHTKWQLCSQHSKRQFCGQHAALVWWMSSLPGHTMDWTQPPDVKVLKPTSICCTDENQ